MGRFALALAWGVFASGMAHGAASSPLGAEFQVNSYTADDQYGARVAVAPNGNLVVVWGSVAQDGHSSGSFAQRFDSGGAPLGTEFQLSIATLYFQGDPDVATAADGSFLVAWEIRDAALNLGIGARRFDSAGNPFGPESPVNLHVANTQAGPGAASGANGNGVAVWHSFGSQDGSGLGVFGRRIDIAGNPVGASSGQCVHSGDQSGQVRVAVGADAAGNFVVAAELRTGRVVRRRVHPAFLQHRNPSGTGSGQHPYSERRRAARSRSIRREISSSPG
jgi:hypothetical protein